MTTAAKSLGRISPTAAVFCPNCGRDEIPRDGYREMKACGCGGTRILCSRYEWALVDALRDELGWRHARGEVASFDVVEQYPIHTTRYDAARREEHRFEWRFDAAVIIRIPGLLLHCLVEVDGDNHYGREIARDRSKEADAVEDGWARSGGLYVVSNRELRPRRLDGAYDWRKAYLVAAELVREMLGCGLDGDMSRRRW